MSEPTPQPHATGAATVFAGLAQPSAYCARVVENPSRRRDTDACNRHDADCDDPATIPGSPAACCDPDIPKTIQERASTSPSWYEPALVGVPAP